MAAEAEALVEQRDVEAAALGTRWKLSRAEIERSKAANAEALSAAAQSAAHLGRELAESRDRARELAAECERLTGRSLSVNVRSRRMPGLARQGRSRGPQDTAAPGAGGRACQS